MNHRVVSVGDILSPVTRPEAVDPTTRYEVLGARLYAKGLYVRETLFGAEIRSPRLFRVRSGDFVYNRLFAARGTFALVTDEFDGCVVSNEFLCYRPKDIVDPEYLRHYFSQPDVWDEVLQHSTGSTPGSRNRLSGREFLRIEMPLPDLGSQLAIARDLGQIEVSVSRMREHRIHTAGLTDLIFHSKLEALILGVTSQTVSERLGSYVVSHDSGWSPKCEDRPARSSEWGVLKTTSVQWSGFDANENKALRLGDRPRPEMQVNEGDVLITRAGPTNRVGVACVVRSPHEHLMLSDKLVRLRLNDRLLPEYVALAIAGSRAQDYLRRSKTGLASSQVNISRDQLLELELSVPSLSDQRRAIAAALALRERLGAMNRLQDQSSEVLNHLMPSARRAAFGALVPFD
jgi:hypothetical protein